MAMNNSRHFDIVVIGAGFAGALTALGLHQIGYDVALIEKSSHPRFAIGESSTPIADIILRSLSNRYGLTFLQEISRYGSWQQTHPAIGCGLKRGFSYYKHRAEQPFQTDQNHTNELLVAASSDNKQSDTHWYRSEVDAFFVDQVMQRGIPYWDNTRITKIQRLREEWQISAANHDNILEFRANWLIDATGSDGILNQLGIHSNSKEFRTRTSALFSHFSGVKPWQDWLHEKNISSQDYPYNPDHSALHHLLDEGWLWMLRFNNGITSAGLVFNRHKQQTTQLWDKIIGRYPSLAALFEDATLAPSPGNLIHTNRLQRRAEKAAGPGWVALPHTVGFVDPLHSTGIAHSLSGVERILQSFENGKGKPNLIKQTLRQYEQAVFNEMDFIDLLVNGCYLAMDHFELFHAFASLYFTAAIHYEQKRINGNFEIRDQFLSADHSDILSITDESYRHLRDLLDQKPITKNDIKTFRRAVENAIKPHNSAGLLHPDLPNMYYHTSADI